MSDVKKNSVEMIAKHFGQRIAGLYEANFKEKEDSVVLVMMRELLTDYLGEEQTQKEMLKINNSLN